MFGRLRSAFADRSADDETPGDNRRHQRTPVCLNAVVYPIDFFSDVTIQNVSTSGFMGKADVELTIGDVLHLTLDNKAFQTGTVRWTEGQNFGVEFDAPLAEVGCDDGADLGFVDGHRPRARRAALNIPARLCLGPPSQPGTVRNVSQSGMMIETAPELAHGQHLLVKLGHRSPVAAVMKWGKDGQIGIETTEPIGILSLVYTND